MYDLVSQLPVIGSPEMREDVNSLKKNKNRVDAMSSTFDFFINGNWLYENKQIYEVIDKLSAEERMEFNADCRTMDWPLFLQNYIEGLAIWVLKEDKVAPVHGLRQMIIKNKFFGDHMKLLWNSQQNFIAKNS
jgi:hypothetical protein